MDPHRTDPVPASLFTRIQSALSFILPENITVAPRHLGELSWLVGGQVGTVLLSILTVKIVTSVGPEDYGLFVLVTSIGGLFLSGFFGPMEQGFIRNYFDYAGDPASRRCYFGTIRRLFGHGIALLALILVLAALIADAADAAGPLLLLAAAFLILVTIPSAPIAGMLNAMRRRKEVAITQVGEKFTSLVLLGTLLFLGSITIPWVMVAIGLSGAAWFVVRAALYRRVVALDVESGESTREAPLDASGIRSKIVAYSLPFVAWGLVSWLQINGERWVIGGLLTTADVGRFGLASTLINSSVVMAVQVLAQYLTPLIFEKFSSSDPAARRTAHSLVRASAVVTMVLFAVLGVFLLIAGEWLIHLLSTAEFVMDPGLLCLLSLGWGLYYTAQMMTNVGLGLQQPRVYMVPKVTMSMLSVAGYLAGCSLGGIAGLVYALVVVNAGYFVWILFVNRRFTAGR